VKQKFVIWLFGVFLAIALSFNPIGIKLQPISSTAASAAVTTPASSEIRGVWLTNVASGVYFIPGGIHRAVQQLVRSQFNTVYPVVWNRGYTQYPSQQMQKLVGRSQDPWFNLFRWGGDALADLVQVNQAWGDRAMRVIPWFEYGLMVPLQSAIVQQHPDWLTTRQDGSLTAGDIEAEALPDDSTNKQTSAVKGAVKGAGKSTGKAAVKDDRAWLNPAHPEVQAFILSLITEVMTHYNVDGIQLDDHFAFPIDFGYDDYTIMLYRQEHNGNNPPMDVHHPEWMAWRADKLSQLMGRIATTVKDRKASAIVSLSPNPLGFAYREYLQDWQNWVEQGWLDELVLQVYRRELGSFESELNQGAVLAAKDKIPVAIGIHTGSLRHSVKLQQIEEQVASVRLHGLKGVSFFYWESLWGYIAPESPRERRDGFAKVLSGNQPSATAHSQSKQQV
jgi:uncharacterized lipoprotein YddW (UPF0748 family)